MIITKPNFSISKFEISKNSSFQRKFWKLESVSPHNQVISLQPENSPIIPTKTIYTRKNMWRFIFWYRIFDIWPTIDIWITMHIKYTKESKDQKRYLLGPNIIVKLDCGWNNRSWITKRLSLIQNSERNQKVNIYLLLVKESPSLRLAN